MGLGEVRGRREREARAQRKRDRVDDPTPYLTIFIEKADAATARVARRRGWGAAGDRSPAPRAAGRRAAGAKPREDACIEVGGWGKPRGFCNRRGDEKKTMDRMRESGESALCVC